MSVIGMQPEAHLYALRQWAKSRAERGLDVVLVERDERQVTTWTSLGCYRWGDTEEWRESKGNWERDRHHLEDVFESINRAAAILVSENEAP